VVDLGRHQRPVLVERDPHGGVLVAGLAGRQQVLAAVLDPLQRGGDLAGREQHAHVLPQGQHLLAEAAAGVAGDHPDAVLGQAEHPGAERPHFVGGLGRGPHRELAAARLPLGHHAAGLHRHGQVRLLVDRRRGHVGRLVEGRGQHLGRHPADLPGDIAGLRLVHQVLGLAGGLVVDHRGQRVEVEGHQVDGVLGHIAVDGHDQGDGVAHEADLALRQRRLGRVRHQRAHRRVPRLVDVGVEVGGHEHGHHAGQRQCLGGVHAHDAGPGHRAAHEAGVQHPGPDHVVDEGAVPGQQAGVLDPRDAGAGVAGRAGCERGMVHVRRT
jgi:hypothetical protein